MTPAPVESKPTPTGAWIPPLVITVLVVGVGVGWLLRGSDAPPPFPERLTASRTRQDLPKKAVEAKPVPKETKPVMPAKKAEDLSAPANAETTPAPIVGDLPNLPTTIPSGPLAPLTPTPAQRGDLKADEALVRRIVTEQEGDVVSAESSEDLGRTLVAEVAPERQSSLKSALRKTLGSRAVLTDAGTVPGSTPELKRMEDELALARKRRDQARLDFLPEAPILKGIEEDTLALERRITEVRRAAARVRLNVLLRSGV
jgi:hypothetical protein